LLVEGGEWAVRLEQVSANGDRPAGGAGYLAGR
jgi:hypothetical protein